jgi:pyruvate dehydrogenase E2 component (dihydrolipoamide acetyltransferase)
MAIVADEAVAEAEIDSFVARFEADFAVAAKEAAVAGPQNRAVDVAGTTINYVAMGEGGVPIVFLHGFGGDLNGWMFNQPVLAGARATFALDLPGHGGSSKDVGDGSVEFLAGIVASALDGLEIERAPLVGQSLGGAIAATAAAAHPARVAALTLISSAGLGREINIGFIDAFIAASGRKDLLPVLQTLFADPTLVTRDMVNETLKFKRLDGVDAALRTIAQASFPAGTQALQLRDRLAQLTMPVQVVFGAEDKIIPPSHAAGLAANVKVQILPGAGHVPHMEKAGDVNKLIETLGPAA